MFGRVSTVPIRDYLEAEYREIGYVGGNGGEGIYLAKKFNDEYVKVNGIYRPKLSGWIDINDTTGERSYPDYAFPSSLPEWVVTKEISYFSGAIANAKRYIIETDGSIGPFTLQEALYFYSVIKKLKPESLNQTVSTSGAGFSFDVPLSNNVEYSYSPVFVPDENDPRDLFTPSLKGRSVLYSADSKYENNIEDDNGSSFAGNVEVFTGGAYFSYGDTNVSIAVDVDDLSKFYICGWKEDQFFDSGVLYNASAGASAGTTINSGPPDYIGGTSGKSIGKSVYLVIHKFKTEFNGTELSNVGDTASKTETGNNDSSIVTEVEYIESSAIFSFGSVSKTIKTYGLATTTTTTTSYGDSPPPLPDAAVTGLTPASPIEIKANEFWPYKTASGQPVYNTTTGAIVNSPLS